MTRPRRERRPNVVAGMLFGVLVVALVWAVAFAACWRFAEWLQQ